EGRKRWVSGMDFSGHRHLKVYRLAYALAMEIYQVSKKFPSEERYSLTDQIRRSSRSVAANVAEAWRKRQYPAAFVNRLVEADGEATETQVWLDFALGCGYVIRDDHARLMKRCEEIGRMLGGMLSYPERFSS